MDSIDKIILKMLSQNATASATEVAARVGYDNYGNFYRVYKKHLGTAPSQHKR